jgi:hypothetical protein
MVGSILDAYSQVKSVVDETILFARGEFGLELGEIGASSWMTTTSPSRIA